MSILLTTAGDILLQTLWGQWHAGGNKLNLKHKFFGHFHVFPSLPTPLSCIPSQDSGRTSNNNWHVTSASPLRTHEDILKEKQKLLIVL